MSIKLCSDSVTSNRMTSACTPWKILIQRFLRYMIYICINLPTSSNIFFNWVARQSTFDHCDFRTILPWKIIRPHSSCREPPAFLQKAMDGSWMWMFWVDWDRGSHGFLNPKTPGRLSASGQYLPKSGGCIATSRTGRPCQIPRATKLMPYCKPCDLANLMVLVVFSPNFLLFKKEDQKVYQVVLTAAVGMPNNFLCASLHSEPRYDERRSVSESREAPKIWKDFGSYEKPSQRLLCGMVGQALSQETSTFQANGMGLGNKQRYGGCYTVQGISTEVLRMSRRDWDHNLPACSFNFSPWKLKDWVTGPSELPTIDFAPNSVAASDEFLTRMQWWRGLIDFWDDLNVHRWFSSNTWRDAIPKRHTKTQDVLLKSGEKLAAIVFQTLRPIPRNWQAAS